MNSNGLNNVRSALDATHSASTSQSRRNELYRFLESQTSDPFKCKEMGYHFIKCGQDHYRLFGYHCIRKICNKWKTLPSRDRKDLKNLAIHLFKFKNLSNVSNITLLKEKISELIVTLAIYNWPHEWQNLLPSLFQISQQNPISLEILFIILKDLYFYCGERQIIPEKRKKSIKDALMKKNKQIMQIFSITLSQCYQQIFENNNNNNKNNNNNNIKIAQNILRRCLEAMPKYLNQFPLKTILLDSQVLIGLAKILQSVAKTSKNTNVPLCYDEFYRFGLLSNIYFFMRKFSELNNHSDDKIQQEQVILTVWSIELDTAKGLYVMTHQDNQNQNENNNLALQRLDNMLECMIRKLKLFSKLLAKNTELEVDKLLTNNKDPKNRELSQSIRDIVLGISESCMKSCDLRIRLRSMNIWSYLLNEIVTLEMIGYSITDGVLGQSEQFQTIIIGIMKYVLNHFRVKFHDLKSFETQQEWQKCRTTLKSKISYLLRQCFVLSPYGGMECVGQFTLSILNCDRDITNINSIGHSTIENERYIALDGLCDVYRIIFENSINYKFKRDKRKKNKQSNHNTIDEALFDDNSPLINMVMQLHQILLQWTCNEKENSFDTQLMSRIYPLLSYLIPLYCRKADYLQKTFDKLLTDFPKLLPLAPNANDAFDIKCNAVAHKRKIAFALLHIAKRIPHICVQYIEPIWKQVMQIIQANFSTFKSIANENEKEHKNKTVCNVVNGVYMASIMDISEGPLCHLFELLVCISNGLDDTNKRSKVLSDLLKDVIDNFNCSEIQNVLNNSNLFAKMIQFPNPTNKNNNVVDCMDQRVRFAYHIRTILNILQSTLTASLLSEGETGLKDLFHTANLDGLPKFLGKGNYNGNYEGGIASWPLFCAVFANVLKFNKLLSYMYTAEFKSKLSKNYHSIVTALDVKSLYNIYGLKYDQLIRNPMSKPKEIIPLEKAVIWIQNVRDYVCRIMAVSSYFNKQFFENNNAMNMIIESVTSYWDELPLTHLSILIKHFFMNFVQLCSPLYYENIIEFIYKFLSQCFEKLNKCWQQYIDEFMINNNININNNILFNNNNNNRQTSSSLKNEVYHEFALRDSSQKLWMSIALLTINHKERGFILLYDDKASRNFKKKTLKTNSKAAKNINNDFLKTNFPSYVIDEEKENSKNQNENEKEQKINLKQDKLVMLILKNENLCKCLLCGIECSLNWLDNNCHVRISQVASKIISFIAKYRMEYLYVQCGKIFESTLNALSRNVIGDAQTNAELNILCVTICQLLGPLASNIIVAVLQNISNVHMDDAKSLINIITSQPDTHPNASYRQAIKAFTNKYVIGKQNILSNANKK